MSCVPGPSSSRKRKYACRKCAVVGCPNNDLNYEHIHTFPSLRDDGSNHEVLVKWIECCANVSLLNQAPKDFNKRYFICGCHFDEGQYVTAAKRQRLRKGAVPLLHRPNLLSSTAIDMYKTKHFSQSVVFSTETSRLLQASQARNVVGQDDMSCSKQAVNSTILDSSIDVSSVSSGHYSDIAVVSSDVSSTEVLRTEPAELLKGLQARNITSHDHVYSSVSCLNHSVNSMIADQFTGVPSLSISHYSDIVVVLADVSSTEVLGTESTKLQGSQARKIIYHDHMYPAADNTNMSMSSMSVDPLIGVPSTSTFLSDFEIEMVSISASETADDINCNEPDENALSVDDMGNSKPSSASFTSYGIDFVDVSEEVVVETHQFSLSLNKAVKRRCVVNGCLQNDTTHSMFAFPCSSETVDEVSLKRCQRWIKFSGNLRITSKNVKMLNKHFYVCEAHFVASNYCMVSDRKQLKKGTVPTLLSPQPLSDETVQAYLQSCGIAFAAPNVSDQALEMELVMRQHPSDKYGDLRCLKSRNLSKNFENRVKSFKMVYCEVCKEKYLSYLGLKRAHRSKKCCKKFSALNNMDPGSVPECLSDLTFIEKNLIARVHPVLSVYKLKGLQYGYRGNVIIFCQDVKSFAKQLPHRIEDLSSIITVKFENNKSETYEFRVRGHKVKAALLWLMEHNSYYHDVEISNENLESLPEDENVFERLSRFSMVESDCDSSDVSADEEDNEEKGSVCDSKDEGEKITRSGMPMQGFNTQNDQISSVLNWPHMSSEPISEFTPGFIVCAFPTLFPIGGCDLKDHREQEVKMHDYFKHLLCYSDDRFAKHKSFRFFAFNMWLRHTALTSGNVFVKKDTVVSQMNVEQLKEHLQSNPSAMKKLLFMGSNIRGSKSYWKSRCGELRDMVEQLGLPTIFLTMSAADLYWPDLFRLLSGEEDNSKIRMSERRRLSQENPLVVDMFFYFRLQCFIESVLEPKFGVIDFWYRIEYQHSQGLTLEKAVIDIGRSEFALGLSYVGLSRVKSLEGLLLNPFPYKRLECIKSRPELVHRKNFECLLYQN